MRFTLLITLLITAAVGFSPSPQATAEKPHIKIIKGAVHPGPPLEPQEGEKFEVDPATGDVLVEYRNPDGSLASQRIEVATKVKPEVDARWELAAAGLVRYSYVLKNLQGAEQNVGMFTVAMSDPEPISNSKAPPNWRASGASLAEWGTPSRYNWWPGDYQQGIPPGAQAGPFSFESPHLPGLTHLYVQGRVESESGYSMSGMSEWMLDQAFQKTRFEHNTVQPLTIGPVIPIGPDVQAGQVINGIRSHVMPIMGRREFREWEPQLTALVNLLSSGNRTAILDVRPALARMGTTPLQKAFFSAIAFNLDYVSRMP